MPPSARHQQIPGRRIRIPSQLTAGPVLEDRISLRPLRVGQSADLRLWNGCGHHPFFFFNDTPTTEIYTLSLHVALPICASSERDCLRKSGTQCSSKSAPCCATV